MLNFTDAGYHQCPLAESFIKTCQEGVSSKVFAPIPPTNAQNLLQKTDDDQVPYYCHGHTAVGRLLIDVVPVVVVMQLLRKMKMRKQLQALLLEPRPLPILVSE